MPKLILFTVLGSALLVACGGDDPGNPACDITVAPSADDQTAVQQALVTVAAGQTICFEGTYTFTDELTLSQDDVTLLSVGTGAQWEFGMQMVGANGLRVQAVSGFRMEGIHVHDTPGDSIRVENSTDVELVGVKVVWTAGPSDANGAYGLYPVGCTNVLIDDCEVSGARDAGIYVGQSENIIVRNSLAYGNVAGIEIENSMNAEVVGNEARDNTAGVLVFDLPGLPAGNGGGTRVTDNDIYENNRMNFGETGTIVASVPHGLGMMVLAVDQIEVDGNRIHDNVSSGIAIVSWPLGALLSANDPMPPPPYDGFPETIYVHDNTFMNNGATPFPLLTVFGGPPLEDILWDGIVDPMKDNSDGSLSLCVQESAATFRDAGVTFMGTDIMVDPSTDVTPHDCTHASRPPVMNGLPRP
jgi:parallel beta-helix repeat protein